MIDRLSLGVCMLSERSLGGFVSYQVDPLGGLQGGGDGLPCVSPHGFRSRPQDPTVGPSGELVEGADLLVLHGGREAHAWPAQDPRWTSVLPDEGKGGALVYAALKAGAWRGASYLLLEGDDGAMTLRVPYAAGTLAHEIAIDPTAGTITISHGTGTTITVTAAGLIELGGALAVPLALAPAVEAWAASVVSALAGLGVTLPPLSASATKVLGL